MPKFRSKPREIVAEQFLGMMAQRPKGACNCSPKSYNHHAEGWHVHTMHGGQPISLLYGDWVVPEPDGVHFYTIDAAVMRTNYERIEENEDAKTDQ